MKLSEFTGIGRPLNPKYPTNIAIIVLSAIVAIAAAAISLLQGADYLAVLIESLRASATFFLGWAIAREYDPDHPYSAFLAAAAMVTAYFFGYAGNLLFLALLLLMMRYINRSTGIPATTIDMAAGIVLIAWLAWTMDWVVALIGSAGFALDGLLDKEKNDRFFFAVFTLTIAVASRVWGPGSAGFSGINAQVIAISVALAAIGLPLYLSYSEVRSQCDLTDEPLQPIRIRWTQIFYIGSTIIIGLKLGMANSGDIPAAGSVVVATAVYYVLSVILHGNRSSHS